MRILIGLLFFALLWTSCSHKIVENENSIERAIANAPITIDEIFSFKSSGKKTKNYTKDIKLLIEEHGSSQKFASRAELVLDSSLPKDIAFKLELKVIDNNFVFQIRHSSAGVSDPEAIVHVVSFFKGLFEGHNVNTNLSVFEMYLNAKEGDLESLNNFLKMKKEIRSYLYLPSDLESSIESSMKTLQSEVDEQIKALAPLIKKQNQERKALKLKRKAALDALDDAAKDKQFKALAAQNDREGIVQLLKKYLPYEDMAPFEKKYWDTYLEIIRKPLPLHQRVIVYRGIDDDLFNAAVENGEELEKEAAIKEGKAFVMSTIMTKNQGSYNRRLRSLEAMYEKTIGTVNGESEFSRSARITTMFKNHSEDPVGSPFLSMTPNVDIASSFGSSRNSAYLVDPRAIQFNFTSGFENEKEFLLGLTTFPEDMFGYWSSEFHQATVPKKYFQDKLLERIEKEYGKADRDTIIKEIEKNTADFFKPVFSTGSKSKSTYKGSVLQFFKGFFKSSPKTPALNISPDGDLGCDSLIKAFWVN